jgi:hypothetical protein
MTDEMLQWVGSSDAPPRRDTREKTADKIAGYTLACGRTTYCVRHYLHPHRIERCPWWEAFLFLDLDAKVALLKAWFQGKT